ncbi:MAG: hypothetical protein CV087_08910 [Candidatus Brocadia sp. WS118]|nr:MAG: hypothetical protein CV087_08910 [Candidatus Brocadia sp. WS118]
MGKTISKTLDEVMQHLPDKPLREFANDFEPDTSDIPEITPEEFERMHHYIEENRALCGIIRALIEHNNLSVEKAQSKIGSISAETLNLIMQSGQVPLSNSFLMISISLLMMDRKIEIPAIVGKALKALAKSAA